MALPTLLALVSLGCLPDDRYVRCRPSADDCGTYEVDDETWEYSCVTVETDTTHGSFCARSCERSCGSRGGFDAVCFRFADDEAGWCYQRCEQDEDCYPSSRCVVSERDDGWTGGICLPDDDSDASR